MNIRRQSACAGACVLLLACTVPVNPTVVLPPTATVVSPTIAPAVSPTSVPTVQVRATDVPTPAPSAIPLPTRTPTATPKPAHPLGVEVMRQGNYPGSEIVIEQNLPRGANYAQYLASYRSEGLKIFAVLTVPDGPRPSTGWPVIVFNHGYIPPAAWRTTSNYAGYTDPFARAGYIVFKPDYRGHGNSEGEAASGYGSSGYTIDVMNATRAVKRFKDADPNRIGMWGHSMGGALTLRSMVTLPAGEIRAGVIWAGVVAPYDDLITKWVPPSIAQLPPAARAWRDGLISEFGSPAENPAFWAAISPNSHLATVSPIQIHHGSADADVPVAFGRTLASQLKTAGREQTYYEYAGDDHNLSRNFGLAMQRSVAWFDTYVKAAR